MLPARPDPNLAEARPAATPRAGVPPFAARLWARLNRPVGGRHERGVALLIVLSMVTVLSAFGYTFLYRSTVNVFVASNVQREVQAYYNARSAMAIARLVVQSGQFLQGAMSQVGMRGRNIELWMFACEFAKVFATGKFELFGTTIVDMKGVEGIGSKVGTFGCDIEPEDGKINVGRVASPQEKKEMFENLFAQLRRFQHTDLFSDDERAMAEVALNIIDWVDPDDNKTDVDFGPPIAILEAGGAGEGADYAEFHYKPKNAKFDSTEELRLVSGMSEELFCELGQNMTVYNTQKVNVNAADIEVIKSLLCQHVQGDPYLLCGYGGTAPGAMGTPVDIVAGFVEMCRNVKRALYTPPFSTPDKFVGFFDMLAGIQHPLLDLAGDFRVNKSTLTMAIGTTSRVLRITAWGTAGREPRVYTKALTSVLDTSTGKTIYWREY